MKTQIKLLVAAIMVLAVIFSSCKKDKADRIDSDYSTELSAQSDDQSRVSAETDDIANDMNDILDDHPSINGRITRIICDATVVVDSLSDPKTVTITYNGTNCAGNRTRTGVVVLSTPLGVHWNEAGAVITASIQNLKITRLQDNKSITINGTTTFTNVTGGRLHDLSSLGSITHEINSSGITISFDNGTQRTWQVAKRRVFTYDNGIVITTSGTHTDGTTNGISEWGTNRFGNAFVTSIIEPKIVRQDCGMRLVSGKVRHDRLMTDVAVTFGLDAAGNPTACPGTGNYYFKLVWTGANGIVRTAILPY